MRRSCRRAAAAASVLVMTAAAAPGAGADWLVLRDGSRVETRGAWKEKGRLLVFHTADGTLASLRTAEVDLAASREATAEAERQAAAPAEGPAPEPEARATRRITNADIPPGDPAPPPAATGEATPDAASGPAPAERRAGAAGPVVVGTWDRASRPGENLTFRGTLRNTSDRITAAAVGLQVELTSRDGQALGTRAATVRPSTLPAGATATFEVTFDDVYDYGALRFEIDSIGLRQGGEEDDGAASGEAAGGGGESGENGNR
ncbi:MAG TPA: FxLYD domain-containing protein [Thermoanaerobaculia bacterium]|nr:FxLYD domain-containing protein [Thermoanaerobaculia bacterium]